MNLGTEMSLAQALIENKSNAELKMVCRIAQAGGIDDRDIDSVEILKMRRDY